MRALSRNILDVIRALGESRDREEEGASKALSRAIERLKRQNPFTLKLPEGKEKRHVHNRMEP